jgi:hypothetical protein
MINNVTKWWDYGELNLGDVCFIMFDFGQKGEINEGQDST